MEKIVRGSDLSAGELQTLRQIVFRGFLSRGAISQSHREQLRHWAWFIARWAA
jgi:hypothetical protein